MSIFELNQICEVVLTKICQFWNFSKTWLFHICIKGLRWDMNLPKILKVEGKQKEFRAKIVKHNYTQDIWKKNQRDQVKLDRTRNI